ncbi:unnamed protein product [Acanthoscelides obtectus]|uniref:Uncharacterized protein n=1 Tax=Acanthoscelides obtectus TaxID=200917 RepID=A0A9P0KSG5_ACAOB|nr:unnamed protein product [Acanthoscelides obtectus]CAK1675867.1 hypothetical protein AOBTE_LOCUS30449 [Acanthoscelides obtectus]
MYDRLARLKEILGIGGGRQRLPFGIKEGENVVTFRKVSTNPPIRQARLGPVNSRKRKKPGAAPPLSSIEDKGRLGSAAPLTSAATADPSSAPPVHPSDPDKGFYENLPFHGMQNPPNKNAFYTLNPPHFKQLTPAEQPPQYSATIPHQHHHQKHSSQLLPKALFQEPLSKSKSFNNKSKQKKHHFQIPLQKCNSFKFQTAESYFQPIKNLHEENLMRNGYASDYQEDTHRRQKREKHKKAKGPLVLRRPGPGGHQESVHFQVNMQNSIQLQYPQPVLGPHQRANGVVYADLDMPSSGSGSKQGSYDSNSLKNGKKKSKTEYATLKFDDVGQEIDV